MNEGPACKVPPHKPGKLLGWLGILGVGACGILCCGLAPVLFAAGAGFGLSSLLAWGRKYDLVLLFIGVVVVLFALWWRSRRQRT
ncbi:hypothetical protein [Deinococcus cellulosilyticus]|uniref:Mercuric ion transport protein n=1 Tax=Deinococcus cellulosilyticus (strain DSM 18568 / NBRC 106333 / KACC 11606 / 5516J-15) TaxID=1223518 RepID=A0A511MY39_DEIC1|nr:hypothetical protein [Deinococcus cellulosilyticus]GEM45489.1 hypothetical protein DC3_11240 [Deinococcus cellulosilyticus NBRC 106333 = KACC 11606]